MNHNDHELQPSPESEEAEMEILFWVDAEKLSRQAAINLKNIEEMIKQVESPNSERTPCAKICLSSNLL
jgi:hypothetical protein